MAKEILASEFMSESLRRTLAEAKAPAVSPLEVIKLPLITNIPTPHQILSVPAGEKKTVFKFTLPDDCVGFILRVANVYYEDDDVRWKMDGKEVDIGHIRRVIGTINAPFEVAPWFRLPFYVSTIWEVENPDSIAHYYEVLNDGFYISKNDLPLLFRIAGVR